MSSIIKGTRAQMDEVKRKFGSVRRALAALQEDNPSLVETAILTITRTGARVSFGDKLYTYDGIGVRTSIDSSPEVKEVPTAVPASDFYSRAMPEGLHVDDFIDTYFTQHCYARWFFSLHRLPAVLQADFKQWINQYKLFCSYEGTRYRVTGCSRMGDVWLSADFKREVGYELRVDVSHCSAWSDKP